MVEPDPIEVEVNADTTEIEAATEAVQDLEDALLRLERTGLDIFSGGESQQRLGMETTVPMDVTKEIGDIASRAVCEEVPGDETPDDLRILGIEAPNIVRWEYKNQSDSDGDSEDD